MTKTSAADLTRARSDFGPPPEERQLPPLALWIYKRGLRLKDVAGPFGCSAEYVRLICLPFDDPARRVPTAEVVGNIHAYTQGAIGPADHYPPHLNGSPSPAETDAA